MTDNRQRGGEAREWALVTGASSGIGAAIARNLARRSYDIIVCGRDAERVEETRSACGEQSIGIVADFHDEGGAESVIDLLRVRDIHPAVLVNNAGATVHGLFAETELDAELDLLRLQIESSMKLTKALLPDMIARRRGRILNVGSIYGFAAAPFQASYAGCKAYLRAFTASLRAELEGTGVTATLVSPGLTRTRFRSRVGLPDKRSRMTMEAEEVARASCEALLAGRASIVPGRMNRLFVLSTRFLSQRWAVGLVRRVNDKRRMGGGS